VGPAAYVRRRTGAVLVGVPRRRPGQRPDRAGGGTSAPGSGRRHRGARRPFPHHHQRARGAGTHPGARLLRRHGVGRFCGRPCARRSPRAVLRLAGGVVGERAHRSGRRAAHARPHPRNRFCHRAPPAGCRRRVARDRRRGRRRLQHLRRADERLAVVADDWDTPGGVHSHRRVHCRRAPPSRSTRPARYFAAARTTGRQPLYGHDRGVVGGRAPRRPPLSPAGAALLAARDRPRHGAPGDRRLPRRHPGGPDRPSGRAQSFLGCVRRLCCRGAAAPSLGAWVAELHASRGRLHARRLRHGHRRLRCHGGGHAGRGRRRTGTGWRPGQHEPPSRRRPRGSSGSRGDRHEGDVRWHRCPGPLGGAGDRRRGRCGRHHRVPRRWCARPGSPDTSAGVETARTCSTSGASIPTLRAGHASKGNHDHDNPRYWKCGVGGQARGRGSSVTDDDRFP